MISTRKDRSITAFIQELNQHIRRQENQMCTCMIDLKKAMTRITELEEEHKATREDYMEEIEVLMEKNDNLVKKIGVFMGFPATGGEDDDCTCRRTTSSSTTPTRTQTIAMMTMLMKLEQISWSL